MLLLSRSGPLGCLMACVLCWGSSSLLSQASRPAPPPHEDLRQEKDRDIPAGDEGLVTSILRPKRPFQDVLPSWNLDVPAGVGVQVELQVGDAKGWSPWLHIGDWGRLPKLERRVRCARGKVAIDIFRSDKMLDRARLRFRLHPAPRAGGDAEADNEGAPGRKREIPETSRATLRRLHVTFTDRRGGLRARAPTTKNIPEPLTIPLIRQGEAPKAISSDVCSPTAVAMVLRHHGKKVGLVPTCEGIRDPHHEIFGVWNRAVQYAWTKGVPGYLTRMSDWDDVLAHTRAGRPLIISIAFKKGQLRNAAFPYSTGHLIAILGLTPDGKQVVCADPGTGPKESVRRLYHRADLDQCWIARGGYTYVLAH